MINISLNDLLSSPETAPVASQRPGDASAFTGLLDQFDRSQAEQPKPARTARGRNEHDQTASRDEISGDDQAARRPASNAKAKPAGPAARDATATPDDSATKSIQADKTSAAATAPDSAPPNDDTPADAREDTDGVVLPQAAAPKVTVDDQTVPQLTLTMAAIPSAADSSADADGSDADPAAPVAAPPTAPTEDADNATATAPVPAAAPPSPAIKTPQVAQTPAADAAIAPNPTTQTETTTPVTADAAQSADVSKRTDNAALQIAVRVSSEEPKSLKAPVALANGMTQTNPTETASQPQTAAAVTSAPSAAAVTGEAANPAVQPQAPMPGVTPAFAALAEAASDSAAPLPTRLAGEPVGVAAPSSPGQTATPAAQGLSSVASKPTPMPQQVTEQIAVHIAKAATDGTDKINVKLKPASLGHVEIQLDLASDGHVRVVVSADRPETLDLLQRDARGLERALNDAGLHADQQSLSFNLRDHSQPQNGGKDELAGRMGWKGNAESGDSEPLPAIGGYLNARAAVGGVDIRV